MFTKKTAVVATAAALLSLSLAATAQTTTTTTTSSTTSTTSSTTGTQAVPTAKLVEQYTDLAGSEKNAQSLVTGLRTGSQITLTEDGKTVSFTSPTGKMGNGEIKIVLAMADKLLSGVSNPTNQDLYNALMGDKGVLTMRADGMGWGQIANALGFRLGEVMRSGKADSVAASGQHADSKPEKLAQRPDRAMSPDRIDKPDRPAKPDRPNRGR